MEFGNFTHLLSKSMGRTVSSFWSIEQDPEQKAVDMDILNLSAEPLGKLYSWLPLLIEDYIRVVTRYTVIAYMGHL